MDRNSNTSRIKNGLFSSVSLRFCILNLLKNRLSDTHTKKCPWFVREQPFVFVAGKVFQSWDAGQRGEMIELLS